MKHQEAFNWAGTYAVSMLMVSEPCPGRFLQIIVISFLVYTQLRFHNR